MSLLECFFAFLLPGQFLYLHTHLHPPAVTASCTTVCTRLLISICWCACSRPSAVQRHPRCPTLWFGAAVICRVCKGTAVQAGICRCAFLNLVSLSSVERYAGLPCASGPHAAFRVIWARLRAAATCTFMVWREGGSERFFGFEKDPVTFWRQFHRASFSLSQRTHTASFVFGCAAQIRVS